MYHQVFDIQKNLHADYIAFISEETIIFALYIINRLIFITQADSVHCAVRPASLYKTDNIGP